MTNFMGCIVTVMWITPRNYVLPSHLVFPDFKWNSFWNYDQGNTKVLQVNPNNNPFLKISRWKDLSEKPRLTDSKKRINKTLLIHHHTRTTNFLYLIHWRILSLSFIFQYNSLVPKIQPWNCYSFKNVNVF